MGVLIKPLVTEKMSLQSETLNRYGFIVDGNANKLQIKAAVEKMYSVSVETVNTMNYLGKLKRRNTKSGVVVGRRNSFKKAIISLAEGDTLDIYNSI
ncbi:MAG: 50S ribosomal protein L23 [Flavobacteriales bacterium]|nr:50S ribosomal protein L23 [Flavobacteriales bacterium]